MKGKYTPAGVDREYNKKIYRSEKRCIHGHIGWRYKKTDKCVDCAREAVQRHRYKTLYNDAKPSKMLDIDRIKDTLSRDYWDEYED